MSIAAALELLLQSIAAASKLAALIQNARAEGRTDLTATELATLVSENDAASVALESAIEKARAEGR